MYLRPSAIPRVAHRSLGRTPHSPMLPTSTGGSSSVSMANPRSSLWFALHFAMRSFAAASDGGATQLDSVYAPSSELVKALAEITLVLVLFSDASRVRLRDLRADVGLCLRLLGIGLPLTIGLGVLLALALFHGMSIWLALLVGAALAPTDAALGAGVMVNPAVPARIRRLLNVESGLNDGIATPVVVVAIAGAATAEHAASVGPGAAAAELALGVLVGVCIGGAGGYVVHVARRRGWAE